MDKSKIVTIVLILIATAALIFFLVWKNQKDRKNLNPDAADAMDETIEERRSEKS